MSRIAGLAAGLALTAGVSLLVLADQPGVVEGAARVIDGDTLEIEGYRIRLWGIDAPELAQKCQIHGITTGGELWWDEKCGEDAKAVLVGLVASRRVTCHREDIDRYGRIVATCQADETPLNSEMVRRGWAIDYTRYSGGAYSEEQDHAKRLRLGLWAGEFQEPEAFRRGR